MALKRNHFFKKWEIEWEVMLHTVYSAAEVRGNDVIYHIEEEHGGVFGLGSKKVSKRTSTLHALDPNRAQRICEISRDALNVYISRK